MKKDVTQFNDAVSTTNLVRSLVECLVLTSALKNISVVISKEVMRCDQFYRPNRCHVWYRISDDAVLCFGDVTKYKVKLSV